NGFLIYHVVRSNLAAAGLVTEIVLKGCQRIQPPAKSRGIDVLRQRQIANSFARLLNRKRTMLDAQKARPDGSPADANEIRQLRRIITQLVTDPSPQTRMLQRCRRRITGVHE